MEMKGFAPITCIQGFILKDEYYKYKYRLAGYMYLLIQSKPIAFLKQLPSNKKL
jgi:hypothetical protein